MTRERWEEELLMEFEGLDHLAKLLRATDDMLEEALNEYGSELDTGLVMLLEALRYDLNLVLEGSVKLDNGTVIPGIFKSLDDVQDEVETLQAGKETKKGIKDED